MGAGGLCCLCPALERLLQGTMAFLEVSNVEKLG